MWRRQRWCPASGGPHASCPAGAASPGGAPGQASEPDAQTCARAPRSALASSYLHLTFTAFLLAATAGNPACPLALVGDLNNTRPQRRRGGGGLLLASQHLNDVLRLMAVEVGFP